MLFMHTSPVRSRASKGMSNATELTFLMNGNFFVMPEAQTVHELQGLGGTASGLPRVLVSWINRFSDQFGLTRVFLETLSMFRSSHIIRWFDSPLSMTSYVLLPCLFKIY